MGKGKTNPLLSLNPSIQLARAYTPLNYPPTPSLSPPSSPASPCYFIFPRVSSPNIWGACGGLPLFGDAEGVLGL